MANILSIYDPFFYANNALMILTKALGMASRVYRGYDKTPQQKGSTIQIRRPSTFVAQNAGPGVSADQNVNADSISVVLNQWKEVRFALSDKELTYTGEQIIAEHIFPAAYALADAIDQSLCALWTDIPWTVGTPGTAPTSPTIVAARRLMRLNLVPLDVPELLHFMVDPYGEESFLNQQQFSQWQGAGEEAVKTQMRGTLGTKFGLEIFANQNVAKGTASTAATTGATTISAAFNFGASTMNISAATTATGSLQPGDVIQFAGDNQKYAVQNTVVAAGNAFTGVQVTPHCRNVAGFASGTAVTITAGVAATNNLSFHRNAFALAMAPLSELGDGLGAKIATVSDPVTNLTLRSRIYYVGDNSQVKVGLDVLYGVLTLDPNLAVRAQG